MNNKRTFYDTIVVLDKNINTELKELPHIDYNNLIDIVNVKGGHELTIKHDDGTYVKEFTHQIVFVADEEMRTVNIAVNNHLSRVSFYGTLQTVNFFGKKDIAEALTDKYKSYRYKQKTLEDVYHINEEVVFITLRKAKELKG